jgi:hypothetical protein
LSQDRFSSSTSYSSIPSLSFPSSAFPGLKSSLFYHSNDFPHPPSSSKNHSSLSSHIEDVLSQRDIVGEGIPLLGEPLRLVSNRFAEHVPAVDHEEPATEFEVVRKLGPEATPSSITSARFFILHLQRLIISILEVASNLMMSVYLGLLRPSMAANMLSSSYPRPTLMKKSSLPSSRRYVPRLILAQFRSQKKRLGNDSSVNPCAPQHCNLISHVGNFGVPSPSRICYRSRSVLLSGAGPRSLRCRSCLRSGTEPHSPHPWSSLVTPSISVTLFHPSPFDRFHVRPNV